MQKNLSENGIEDEDPEFEKLDIKAQEWYIPTIHLFFSDDLTVAWRCIRMKRNETDVNDKFRYIFILIHFIFISFIFYNNFYII